MMSLSSVSTHWHNEWGDAMLISDWLSSSHSQLRLVDSWSLSDQWWTLQIWSCSMSNWCPHSVITPLCTNFHFLNITPGAGAAVKSSSWYRASPVVVTSGHALHADHYDHWPWCPGGLTTLDLLTWATYDHNSSRLVLIYNLQLIAGNNMALAFKFIQLNQHLNKELLLDLSLNLQFTIWQQFTFTI